ncbi:MAG: hypothetical protein N2588_10975 [Rhodovarius sp.]|nr:hypothetical protein [Rhodovarius sp.]
MTAMPLIEALAALAAVLLLAMLLARLARRGGLLPQAAAVARGRDRLAVRAMLPLDGRRAALILAVDGREVLLLVGPEGPAVVGWLGGGDG